MQRCKHLILVLLGLVLLTACTGKPDWVQPVTDFELSNYLGKWYEIARLDHSFERGLSKVSAHYSLNQDGSVKVINRGWQEQAGEWSEAQGKARFVSSPDIAHLKVSFFGPFYGSYVVFYLEPDYSSALVSGYNSNYLWILSRTPDLSAERRDSYVQIAQAAGFDTSKLIFPQQ